MSAGQTLAPLALTMGDPGGVGPEIAARAWRALHATGPAFCLIGSAAAMAGGRAPIRVVPDIGAAVAAFPEALPVLDLGPVEARPGEARAETAPAVEAAIRTGAALCLAGAASALVTNPIHKAAMQAAGFAFPGHTEFVASLTHGAPWPAGSPRGPVMMLAGPDLKTVPVSIHVSVAEAAATLTTAAILNVLRVTARALAADFGVKDPRIAVSGLNPHAGEQGVIGREDADIVAPAVAQARALGLAAFGPLAADSLFHPAARAGYDAAVCMLHDQALIPVKTIAFDETVNVTLGLPIVRTSPDHGVALDIAGSGRARPDSLIAAIRLAAEIAERRRASGRTA